MQVFSIRKNAVLPGVLALLALLTPLACNYLGNGPPASQLSLATADRRELQVRVNTNGIIEPIDPASIYAAIDGFVTNLKKREGAEVAQGELLMRLESKQITTSLAEARAALLQARLQANSVLTGPPKEELAALDGSIAENELQLKQRREDLRIEEALLQKGAATREAAEKLQKEVNLLQLRADDLRGKKQALMERYSANQKQWEQERVSELAGQVELLEQQVKAGSILVPRSGLLYSLAVKPGAYVDRGRLLAEVYAPGSVRLRAYVDEPDLGGIAKGQRVMIEWDGLPDRQWPGVVERPADQAVTLGNRSVGYVICSIEGEANELIPNINVRVQIVTATRADALVIPRSCVFSRNGQPTVMVWDGKQTALKPVHLGLVTPQEVEILQGLDAGNKVVTNPGAVTAR